MKTIARIGLAVVGMFALAVAAEASDVTIPNVFTSGTTASAAAVNLNFTAVETAIDDNDARLDALAAGGVTSAYITDSTITTTDIAVDTITAADIAAGAVGTSEIADGAVTSADIAADTITAADIATGAVTTTEILDNTITSADLATNAQIANYAYDALSSTALTSSNTSRGSVTITAPASGGFVLVIASGMVQVTGKTTAGYCSAFVGVSTSGTTMTFYTRFYLSAEVSAGSYNIPWSVHGIFPVSAGAVTFYTVGRNDGTVGTAQLYFGNMTAIFLHY